MVRFLVEPQQRADLLMTGAFIRAQRLPVLSVPPQILQRVGQGRQQFFAQLVKLEKRGLVRPGARPGLRVPVPAKTSWQSARRVFKSLLISSVMLME